MVVMRSEYADAPTLKTEEAVGLREHVDQKSGDVVVVAGVARATDDAAASVADPRLIVDVPAAARHHAFQERADEVDGNESSAELRHFGPADRRLQPLAVVKRGVPPVDRRVITPERHLQLVALVEPDDGALDLGVESRRRRVAGAAHRARGENVSSPKNAMRGESARPYAG